MTPSRSATTSAASSTTGPRAVFTSTADGRIRASAAASIRCRVSGSSGTCRLTTSAASSSSSSESPRPAKSGRAPKLSASRAVSRPILPAPTTPKILPSRLSPSMNSSENSHSRRARMSRSPSVTRRSSDSVKRDRQLGGRPGQHVGRVRDDDPARPRGVEVDVVDADRVVRDHAERRDRRARGTRRRPSSTSRLRIPSAPSGLSTSSKCSRSASSIARGHAPRHVDSRPRASARIVTRDAGRCTRTGTDGRSDRAPARGRRSRALGLEPLARARPPSSPSEASPCSPRRPRRCSAPTSASSCSPTRPRWRRSRSARTASWRTPAAGRSST